MKINNASTFKVQFINNVTNLKELNMSKKLFPVEKSVNFVCLFKMFSGVMLKNPKNKIIFIIKYNKKTDSFSSLFLYSKKILFRSFQKAFQEQKFLNLPASKK